MSRTKAQVDMVTTGRPMWPGQQSGPWTHLRTGPGSFFLCARECEKAREGTWRGRQGAGGPGFSLLQDGLEAAFAIVLDMKCFLMSIFDIKIYLYIFTENII